MTESNIEPLPLEVRKIRIENGEVTLQLYLYTNIEKRQRRDPVTGEDHEIYIYDMTQLSIPLPKIFLDKLDIARIEDPTWHQRPIRCLLMKRLADQTFCHDLSQSMRKEEIREVDQKDHQHPIKALQSYKDFIYLGNPESSGNREPRSELLGELKEVSVIK